MTAPDPVWVTINGIERPGWLIGVVERGRKRGLLRVEVGKGRQRMIVRPDLVKDREERPGDTRWEQLA